MMTRWASVSLASVALVLLTSGCLGTPAPTPTPATPTFSSEAEAFAAAEETYRAYVDALNQERSDPLSADNPQSFLIDLALEVDLETQRQLQEMGVHILGNTRIVTIQPIRRSSRRDSVLLEVCLDSSETSVINDAGADVTPAERPTKTRVSVSLAGQGSALAIEDSSATEPRGC